MARRLGSLSLAALIAAAPAACGSQTQSTSSAPGAQIFQRAGCGTCHTLAAAQATGRTGPDLDVLKPDAASVEKQVRDGDDAMPAFADRLSPSEIHAVAVYVQQVTQQPAR